MTGDVNSNVTHHSGSSGSGTRHGIKFPVTAHNLTAEHDHSTHLPFLSHTPNPYGLKNSHNISPPVNSSTKDTLLVFLTLTFISITLYFTFFLWKKHREKPLATVYKLEEYRYSRLSQNELEVDSIVFYGDSIQADASQVSDDDEEFKPATLQLEEDSLISISSNKPNMNIPCTISTTTTTNVIASMQHHLHHQPLQSANISTSAGSSNLQDSDEDLLQ